MLSTRQVSEAATAVRPAHARNLWLLVGAQTLGGATAPIIISLGGIVGQQLASDPELATLPVSLYNLGLALSTIPAAILMRLLGRSRAYLLGAVLAVLSGLIAAYGISVGSFLTFSVGTALAGFYGACVQSYRFAATEAVETERRPRAISLVMVGGLMAAIIGPQVVIWTREVGSLAPFAGSFVGLAALALLALPLLALLRPTPMAQADQAGGRSLWSIVCTARFVVAAVAGIVSYGLMAFIMTAAPMAMVGHGHSVKDAALGIQWHVLAMFAPSFFTGMLITRFGKIRITALGLAIMAASGWLALQGTGLVEFWGSLILLGLGWNLGFIGATSMLVDAYQPAERMKVQALNDFLVFGTVAVASFSSGHLLHSSGWFSINSLMMPLVATVLLMLGGLAWKERAARSAR